MSTLMLFLILDQSCDRVLSWLSKQLTGAGLRLVQTFDLQDGRSWVSLVTSMGKRPSQQLETAIRHALIPQMPKNSNLGEVAYEAHSRL